MGSGCRGGTRAKAYGPPRAGLFLAGGSAVATFRAGLVPTPPRATSRAPSPDDPEPRRSALSHPASLSRPSTPTNYISKSWIAGRRQMVGLPEMSLPDLEDGRPWLSKEAEICR